MYVEISNEKLQLYVVVVILKCINALILVEVLHISLFHCSAYHKTDLI